MPLRDLPARLAGWPRRVAALTFLALAAVSAIGDQTGTRTSAHGQPDSVRTAGRGPASSGLTAGLPPGFVAAPVQVADAAATHLIKAGDWVDLLEPPAAEGAAAAVVARGLRVLVVVPAAGSGGQLGAELVVAADEQTELRLATAVSGRVFVAVRDPP
jgi:hypothetical protein